MAHVVTIMRKELYSYFSTPMAYVLMAAFLLGNGWLFAMGVFSGNTDMPDNTFKNIATLLVLVCPLITMRLLAEEQRQGTLELLLTSPVRDFELVLGKFLGSLLFVLILLFLTIIYFLIMLVYGQGDVGTILSGYLGLVLVSSTFVAVGLFLSALTQSQVVAGLLSFVVLLVMWGLSRVSLAIGPPLGLFLSYLGLGGHLSSMALGLVETKDLVFYLSVTVGFLALTAFYLETRRWR